MRECAELRALCPIATLARIGHLNVALRRVLRSAGVALVHGGRALLMPLSEVQRRSRR